MLRRALLLAFLAACGSTPPPPPPAPPSPPIVAGPIVLDITIARTAQLFHIVDQLSRWNPMAHLQYARWAVTEHALDDADRDKLKEHAALRKVRGWGSGFEHAFYVKE